MLGLCITDDEVCREASCQEIIRRYLIAECDYKKGKISKESLEREKLLMKEVNRDVLDRRVVKIARDYAEKKRESDEKYMNVVAMAIELENETAITGRSSRRMVAAAAMVLNAIKYLAGIPDDEMIITPEVLETVQNLKTEHFDYSRTSLNCEEILLALSISSTTNPAAEAAMNQLSKLKGCRAHCTAILSDRDEQTLGSLGIDVTCDAEYLTTNLYQ